MVERAGTKSTSGTEFSRKWLGVNFSIQDGHTDDYTRSRHANHDRGSPKSIRLPWRVSLERQTYKYDPCEIAQRTSTAEAERSSSRRAGGEKIPIFGTFPFRVRFHAELSAW